MYQLDKRDMISTLLNNLGVVYISQGSYEAALSKFEDAAVIAEEGEDFESLAVYTNNIASVSHIPHLENAVFGI